MVDKVKVWLTGEVNIFGRSVKKVIFVAIAVVILAVFKGCSFNPDYSGTTPDYYGTFGDAIQAYARNEAQAEDKFNGKIVELSGKVYDSGYRDYNYSDGNILFLPASIYHNGVEYSVRVFVSDSDQDELRKHRPGSVMVVRGKCLGWYIGGAVGYVIDIRDATVVHCFTLNDPNGVVEYYTTSIDKSKMM